MKISLFEKILVPVDGSEHSKNALLVAAEIAKKFNGRLTIVHVYSAFPKIYDVAYYPPAAAKEYMEETVESGKNILSLAENTVKNLGIEVDTALKEGHAVQEVVRISREGKYSLIVMGSRGRGEMTELLLGSVSHGVSQHAGCPVLLVK